MNARVYPAPNQTRTGGQANESVHRVGQDVDSVDQASSLHLLGLAVLGAALVVGIHTLIG
ncbi:hypothetical protein [Methylobacterium iners]|uniref:Uncharacterized protein n=1 Tax=Methylobacterium iners TaxID=418707 RepID=A0ABQ4S4W6_9HYPH|nr:hypothetical protein [Methylobacterium iners]GJD96929.1 hypothetical protein OCOJLMKI_4157 [Methylobacterium iners]